MDLSHLFGFFRLIFPGGTAQAMMGHSNTAETAIYIKEVDRLVIKSLMGHSTTRSTEIYIHPSMQKIQQAMEKLPGVIFMNELIKEGGTIFPARKMSSVSSRGAS